MLQQDQQNTNSSGKAKNRKKKDGSSRDFSHTTAVDEEGRGDPNKSLDEQYQMARKYYLQQEAQEKLAQKIHATNLNMKESQTSSAMEGSISIDVSATVQSSTAVASDDDGIIYDWAEYTDPRTKRKYYYSVSTKKSTWTKPYNFDSIHHQSNMTINAVANGSNSRYESPNVSIRSSKSDNVGSKANYIRPTQNTNTHTNMTPLRLEELDVHESSSAKASRSNTPSSQANMTTEQYNSMFFATRGIAEPTFKLISLPTFPLYTTLLHSIIWQ